MKNTQNLVEQYAEAQQKVRNLLHEFDSKLEAHKKAFVKEPTNWGFVGDLQHYAEVLETLLGKRG